CIVTFFFSSRRRHTRCLSDWSSDVCSSDLIFATLAVDDSQLAGVPGNIYSVFTDNLVAPGVNDIWFTRSSDRGNSWARPVKVNHDKGTHFFPWIAAGTTGRVDFIWLSTPDLSPSDAS